MKKVLLKFLCVGLAMIMFMGQAMAYSTIATALSEEEISAVSNFDETEIYNAFNEVEQLVTYVQANENVTFDELESNHIEMISNISSSSAIAFDGDGETPPIFSAFIWGCLLNWVGMLIVGLATDFNTEQITKSLWGCLISSCLWGGSYGWYTYY